MNELNTMTDDEIKAEAIEIARTTPLDYRTARMLLGHELAFHDDDTFYKIKAASLDGIDLLEKLWEVRILSIMRTVPSCVP